MLLWNDARSFLDVSEASAGVCLCVCMSVCEDEADEREPLKVEISEMERLQQQTGMVVQWMNVRKETG
jgi:hypothetical protein